MKTPKDEMFTTNEQDRERERTRKRRLLRVAMGLFIAAGLIAGMWMCTGCATQKPAPDGWIRTKWLHQEAVKVQGAQKGVVWPATAGKAP